MIKFRIDWGNNCQTLKWEIGQDALTDEVAQRVLWAEATGPERHLVSQNTEGLPRLGYYGEEEPTVRWYGDDARFIAYNVTKIDPRKDNYPGAWYRD